MNIYIVQHAWESGEDYREYEEVFYYSTLELAEEKYCTEVSYDYIGCWRLICVTLDTQEHEDLEVAPWVDDDIYLPDPPQEVEWDGECYCDEDYYDDGDYYERNAKYSYKCYWAAEDFWDSLEQIEEQESWDKWLSQKNSINYQKLQKEALEDLNNELDNLLK